VARVDELDRTFFQRREDGNIGMPAEAKNMFDPSSLEVLDQLVGNQIFHGYLNG
jgi:hypothetical protein